MMNISGLLKSQFALYKGISDNSLLRVKYAQAERLKQTYKDINAKYDGSKAHVYEAKINAIGDEKLAAADQARGLESSLNRVEDMKPQIIALGTALTNSSTEAWDLAYDSMQHYAGSSILNKDNLAGRLSDGGAGFREPTSVLSTGGMAVEVKHHYVAADYTLEMADGTVLRPNQDSKTLAGGNKSFNFADLSVASVSGDQVTFHDAATNQDYAATLHRGGNGMINGWFYNGFDAGGAARAKEDLQAANSYLLKVQSNWAITQGQVEGIVKKLGTQFTQAQKDYEKVSFEQIDAKNAEITAAKTKFDLTTNILSLTAGSATNMIDQMFMTNPIAEKKSIFDVLSDG